MKELIIYDSIRVKVGQADEDAIRALHAAAPEGPAREAASTAYQLKWAQSYQPAFDAAMAEHGDRLRADDEATAVAVAACTAELAVCAAAQLACDNLARGWCSARNLKIGQ